MHPIPVVNWFDWISYINSSTDQTRTTNLKGFKNCINSTNRLKHCLLHCLPSFLKFTYSLVSITLASIIWTLAKGSRTRKCFLSVLLAIVILDYYLPTTSLVSAQSTAATAATVNSIATIVVDSQSTNKTQIDTLSFEAKQHPRTNDLITNNSSHLKNQFFRTIRGIKLTNHRLKHRRSLVDAKNYQSNGAESAGGAGRKKHPLKTNNWSVLGDQEAEYALRVLENEHLTSAILHFIEITYKYAESNSPPDEIVGENSTAAMPDANKKSSNRYYKTGSCVQVKLDSLRGLLKSNIFVKYAKQAETAKRTASLLTTLLSERLELTSDREFIKNHLFIHNDTSDIVLHKAFFWSLLKVNLQSDSNLFANGITFRPDINKFPIKLFFNSVQSSDEDNQNDETNHNSTNKQFSPYIFREKANSFNAKLSTSVSNSSSQPANHSSTYNYINLSGINSFEPRIVPNPVSNKSSNFDASLEDKARSIHDLKNILVNRKQPDPSSNFYAYSADWYLHYANKYLQANTSRSPFNYHELMKSHYLNDSTDPGYWTMPYLDCNIGTWLLSYSVPFFGLSKSTNQIEFRGVVLISIDLSSQDINQCSPDDPFFPDSHKCDRETTDCIPIKNLGFRRGAYVCQCKSSFYIPNVTYSSIKDSSINQTSSFSDTQPMRHFFNGTAVEVAFVDTHVDPSKALSVQAFPSRFQCVACPKDCTECDSTKSCKVSYTGLLRVSVLGVQSFCATIVLILGGTTFRLRRSKNFASSRWIILETLLFGSLLLYITVIIQYFEPSPLNCFITPWFREFGFGFLYGSILIKLYRIYAEFQTRKAHRVCVRDKDLLKYLCAIILVITGYMAAWSALILETINLRNWNQLLESAAEIYIIQIGYTVDNLKYYLCKQLSWDYVTQLGELSFILSGCYLSYCIRNARSEFYREKWALCTCIYIEFVVSASFYILRYFLWNSLHPDLIYLMFFIRCQMTVSIALCLIFGPKIFCQNRPPTSSSTRKSRFFTGNEQVKDRVPEAMKLHAAILSNGDIDVSEVNLSQMDPEDIRVELRRVYTQLQILKNKTIRKDNPHISKRRGGRKTHRRFSLQPFNAHNKSHKSMSAECDECCK